MIHDCDHMVLWDLAFRRLKEQIIHQRCKIRLYTLNALPSRFRQIQSNTPEAWVDIRKENSSSNEAQHYQKVSFLL
jgi:hypothetical protein